MSPAACASETFTFSCGFWTAPATSERSSIRLIRWLPTSEMASSFT